MQPKSLKQSSAGEITIVWDDNHEGRITLQTLRDACPCAGCKGETVLFQTYIPPEPDRSVPGRYELQSATPVGNYALKLTWKDGHEMGMYTWQLLRSLCECDDCLKRHVYR